ncbi:MAG: prepilin-type N-terminal cleavage/methylation domain-containing protein [Planctomycetota bacterium]|nr:prepilin-type N-terminal cleavage/methylation domain-containing protein [Planctomycetota bacterium]
MRVKLKSFRAGYTLTEILVVLGIIVAVATMSLPALIPIMRGRHLKSGSSMLSAALMNARMYAVTYRMDTPLVLAQWSNFNDLGAADKTHAYFATYGKEGIEPYELPPFVQIYPFAIDDNAIKSSPTEPSRLLEVVDNNYVLATFRSDGSALGNALRFYVVDLRSVDVTQTVEWSTATGWFDADANDATGRSEWRYRAVKLNPVTGRVSAVDPEQP